MGDNWVILQSPAYKEWYQTQLTDEEQDAIVATALRLSTADAIYERHLTALAAAAAADRSPKQRAGGHKR